MKDHLLIQHILMLMYNLMFDHNWNKHNNVMTKHQEIKILKEKI